MGLRRCKQCKPIKGRYLSNDLRWMISSDQQIPYHDPKMIELWFKVMKWFKPDVVDYLGDTSDQACFSRFASETSQEFLKAIKKGPSDPLMPFIESEEKPVREFYEQTRKVRPNAQLFSALGNHDIRVWDYVDKNVPELSLLVTPESLWGLDNLGYEYIYYDDLPKHRFGDIHVHHGIAISQNSGESVKKDVENFGVSIMRGHSHRVGDFYKTYELRNETLRGYEIGHMADEKSDGMSYTTIHNWQKAFAVGYIENGEYPHIQVIKVSPDYTCFVGNKKFAV